MAELALIWTVRVVAAGVVVASLLPLVRKDAWWIRGFDFPRVQLLAIAVIALLGSLLVLPTSGERWWVGLAIGGSMLLQAARILPFTPLWPGRDSERVDDGAGAFGLMVFNVLMTNRDAEPLLALARELRPDLLLLVESDHWWQEALAPLRADYPHSVEHPLDNTYGMLLLSRFELTASELRFLVEDDVPSIFARVLVPDCGEVDLYCLHPKPPAPQESTATTGRDAELLMVAEEVRDGSGPTVVAGDLNDVAWSYTTRLFRRISGLLDPRLGRSLFATFPAERWWLRFPLDHVFHSVELKLVDLCLGPPIGSDHLAMFVRLRRVGGEDAAPRPPEPNGDDVALAREKIDRGLAVADGD